MTTTFALLLDRCGLSIREAAAFLQVRPDTVKSWSAGRNGTPLGAIAELRGLYAMIECAATEALSLIVEHPADVVELGLASDDHEARSLGWPCVGVHAALLGLVAARCGRPVTIVPRGSTPATAASADAHDQ